MDNKTAIIEIAEWIGDHPDYARIVRRLKMKGYDNIMVLDILHIITEEIIQPEPEKISVTRATAMLASRIAIA